MVKPHHLLLLALLTPMVARADGEDAKREYETAARFFDAEEFEAALPYFERAYELSGHRPAAILGVAQCLRALKRYGDAIARYEEYLATHPRDAAEVEETLRLLRALRAHADRQTAERAARAAEDERRAREAEAAAAQERAEAARVAEQDRARVRAEATRAAEEAARRIATEHAVEKAPPAPQPAAALPPLTAAAPPPPEDDGSIIESPLFWIVTGALAAGGGTAIALLATHSEADPYAGSSGVLLLPRR
jgi:tetratricopeptide (TPR) repeat protein